MRNIYQSYTILDKSTELKEHFRNPSRAVTLSDFDHYIALSTFLMSVATTWS